MVYSMAKTGEFERQISSDILAKATDLVVYENGVYALVGGKIYLVE